MALKSLLRVYKALLHESLYRIVGSGTASGGIGEMLGLYSTYQVGTEFDSLHPKQLW
jgi:hypothetical protein